MNESRAYVVVLVLLGGLSTAACTTSKALPADEPRATPAPTSTATAGDPELTLDTEGATPAGKPRQPPAAAFGAPCTPDDAVHCGTKGRVAVLVAMRNGMPSKRSDAPCELVKVTDPSMLDQGQGCVKDDRVYLTAGCAYCRQFSEWDMTGIVAEMTDVQLVTAQKRVGLPPEPLLRTAQGWRTALATAAATAPKRRR